MATWTENGTKTSYVVGFMFSRDKRRVLLILKDRPAWQNGLLNGVGGKIDPEEDPAVAMAREFKEETGIETQPKDWGLRIFLDDWRGRAEICMFSTIGDIDAAKQQPGETETPMVVSLDSLPPNVVPNLRWVVPFLAQEAHIANVVGSINTTNAQFGHARKEEIDRLEEQLAALKDLPDPRTI